jgi:hypothetical protein
MNVDQEEPAGPAKIRPAAPADTEPGDAGAGDAGAGDAARPRRTWWAAARPTAADHAGTGADGAGAGAAVARREGSEVDRVEAEQAEAVQVEADEAEVTEAEPADPWSHFGPQPDRVPGRGGRAARAVGRFVIHEWTVVSVIALLVAIVMTWPAAWHPASTIPADIWDPTLQAWQVSWAGHAMLTDPLNVWNSNTFYPDAYTYAFSDTLFGYFPAGMIGNGPAAALVRYNLLFILLHGLAFVGAYALVRQLGAGRTAAAVAGAAFAYAPWRWAQAGHMHVLSVGGIALALAMLARGHGFSFTKGYRPEKTRTGWAVAGWCVAAWQISLGYGIGLPFAYVLATIAIVAIVRWFLRGRPRFGRRLLLADAIGAVVFGAVALLMGLPYLHVLQQHPEARRTLQDVAVFSPSIRAFITAPSQSLPWGAAHEAARATMIAPAETTLLPGFILYGLAAAGLLFSVWSVRTRLWLLAGVVVSIILAMGTQFFGGTYTYVVLYRALPFFSASRTPGRLVIWTTLFLGILAAGAVGALVSRSYELAAERVPGRPGPLLRLATLLPVLLVLAEGTNWHRLDHPVVPAQPAAMRTVDGPLIVLPSDELQDENVMLWSTTRYQKLVNGGSGFRPTDQQNTRLVTRAFPDQGSVDYLRQLGVRTVVVLKAQASTSADYARAADPNTPIDGLGIDRRDDGDTIVYTLH